MSSMQQMSQTIGLPLGGQPPKPSNVSGKPKVRRGRGKKPSGNPLNQHASLFARAHAAGNVAQARTHALNYANASVKSAAPVTAVSQPAMGADDMDAAPLTPSPAAVNPMLAKRAQLAKTLKGLRK